MDRGGLSVNSCVVAHLKEGGSSALVVQRSVVGGDDARRRRIVYVLNLMYYPEFQQKAQDSSPETIFPKNSRKSRATIRGSSNSGPMPNAMVSSVKSKAKYS